MAVVQEDIDRAIRHEREMREQSEDALCERLTRIEAKIDNLNGSGSTAASRQWREIVWVVALVAAGGVLGPEFGKALAAILRGAGP